MFCRKCGKEMNDSDMFCPACGTPVIEGGGDIFPPMGENALPMKWYKFLIYFSLFAGAITSALGAISGVALIFKDIGTYLANPLLFGLEMGCAAINVVYAAFALFTRYALAGYKKRGPLCICIFYGIMGVSEIVYYAYSYVSGELNLLAAEFAIADPMTLLWMNVATTVLTVAVMIAANYIYFSKRKHLFVN